MFEILRFVKVYDPRDGKKSDDIGFSVLIVSDLSLERPLFHMVLSFFQKPHLESVSIYIKTFIAYTFKNVSLN